MAERTAPEVLRRLADESRTVAADWRIHLIHLGLARREGKRLPSDPDSRRLIRKMVDGGSLEPIPDVFGVYCVTAPFASLLRAPDEAIAIEAAPVAALSLRTALFVHGLIHEHPSTIQATVFTHSNHRLPLGTTPEDWIDLPLPSPRTPKEIHARPVHWTRSKAEYDFGIKIGFIDGVPVYVTDLSRTLIDTLRFPEESGGILEVVRSWRAARDTLHVEQLTNYVDQLGQTILRQRVGWILDELKLDFPARETWLRLTKRGGSARLVASSPFADVYSETWSLSLNVLQDILEELRG